MSDIKLQWPPVPFKSLKGKVFSSVERAQINDDQDAILFIEDNGSRYVLVHDQDCCESVYIESIVGDLQDLVGAPILLTEEIVSSSPEEDYCDSTTYTFYKLATIEGYVDLRWCGTSNGYYSESVYLWEV